MSDPIWAELAGRQHGMIARRQLRSLGVPWWQVRDQIAAQRWIPRTSRVISTFTGPPTRAGLRWLGVLHAGGASLVGGLTAATVRGLRNWDRESVTILVDDERMFEPVPGVTFVRTRRPLPRLRDPRSTLPLCLLEPAVLLFAAYTRSPATAYGVLAAVVQQRLTTPQQLGAWIGRMQPLRRAGRFRTAIDEMINGAQSWNEARFGRLCRRFRLAPPRRQARRRGPSGQEWFTDCEWDTPAGDVVVLEIDGPFHMQADRWARDLARHRGLSAPGRIVVRCTTRELHDYPATVMSDLRRLGVPRL